MSGFDKDKLEGYFKERDGDLVHAVPSFAKFTKMVPLRSRQRIGEEYRFPVFLSRSHGVTHKGGANIRTIYDLRDPLSAQSRKAAVKGVEITIQEDVAYGALSASQAEGAAFGDVMDEVTFQMEESAQFYRELNLLYGGDNIGIVSGAPTGSAGTRTLTISKASWATGIWTQMEGACIDVYNTGLAAKRNTTTDIKVTVVAADSRQVTITGLEAELATIVDTDEVVPVEWVGNSMEGMNKHATNVGVLHGIDAATNGLWRPNQVDAASAALTMDLTQQALTKAMGRGLMGDTVMMTSPYSFTDMNTSLSALRRYPSSVSSKADLGTTHIEFHGVTGGKVSVIAHPMVKAGDAFIFQPKHFKRIGSNEISFRLPGAEGQAKNFYQELEGKSGFRLRCWGDEGLIHCRPACLTKIHSIDPTSLA